MSFYDKVLEYIRVKGINSMTHMFDFMLHEIVLARIIKFINIFIIFILTIVYIKLLVVNIDNILNYGFFIFVVIGITVNLYRIFVLSAYIYIIESYNKDFIKTAQSDFLSQKDKEEKIAYIIQIMFKALSNKVKVNRFNLFNIVTTEDSVELKHIF